MELKVRNQHELALHLTEVEGLKQQVNIAQMSEIVSKIENDLELARDLFLNALAKGKPIEKIIATVTDFYRRLVDDGLLDNTNP